MLNRLSILLVVLLMAGCGENDSPANEDVSDVLPNVIMLIGDDQGYPYFEKPSILL